MPCRTLLRLRVVGVRARHAGTKQSNARSLTASGTCPCGPHQRLLLRPHRRRRPCTGDAAAGPHTPQSRSPGPHQGLHTPVTLSCRAECNTGAQGQSFKSVHAPLHQSSAYADQISCMEACMCRWQHLATSHLPDNGQDSHKQCMTLCQRRIMHAARQQVSCALRIS